MTADESRDADTTPTPEPDPDSTLPPCPKRIGPYPVLGELDRGGMGVVYAAEDTKLRRRIALKLLPREVASDPGRLERFQREAQLLAAINHPNIAIIHSMEEAEGLHFLTMELIPGANLAARLAEGPLPLEEALSACRQVASALEEAHKKGVIHRDLKPANIMVTPAGLVKVFDFGIAASRPRGDETEPPDRLTAPGTAMGTPGYMSPEQALGQATDQRTDLWAFGCILYECLTGRKAFGGETALRVIRATLGETPDWSALPAELPEVIRDLLERCLTRELSERIDSATAARQAVEEGIAEWMRSELRVAALPPSRPDEPETRPNNLPLQLDSFVGRASQIEEVKNLLGVTRLLTLVGAGGCGKTRLALEVARTLLASFPDGAWFIGLAPLTDSDRVPEVVGSALGVGEKPRRTLTETLVDHLAAANLLLVLDNCEHLIKGSAELSDTLLRACPNVRILITSREALGIQGETSFRVTPLAVPERDTEAPPEEILQTEAVRLFVERARAVDSTFATTEENLPSILEICRRLDGIPLALELAAARVKALPVDEIRARLEDRFRLLTRGSRVALPHHQTLRALIDWSYDHLTAAEQAVFRRLSVFAGGWTLDAAEAVCAGGGVEDWEVLDLLVGLFDKSLVEIEAHGRQRRRPARYRMLESIRHYARDRLGEAGEEEGIRRRHLAYFHELARRTEPELSGPNQRQWLERLDAERYNLTEAIDWCVANEGEAESGLELAGLLWPFWDVRGHWEAGRAALRRALAASSAGKGGVARARALCGAGNLAQDQGDHASSRRLFEESLEISRARGDRKGVAQAFHGLGIVSHDQGDYDTARSRFEESLRINREIGEQRAAASALHNLGIVYHEQGDLESARRLYTEGLRLRREIGDKRGITASLHSLGIVSWSQADYTAARSLYTESLQLRRELGDRRGIAASLNALGILASAQGDHESARALHEESIQIFRELGDRRAVAYSLHSLGVVALEQRDHDAARSLFEESSQICRQLGDRRAVAYSLHGLGTAANELGDHEAARALFEEALQIGEELGDRRGIAAAFGNLGLVARRRGDLEGARALHAKGLRLLQELGDKRGMADSLEQLGSLAVALGRHAAAARTLGAARALREEIGVPPSQSDLERLEDDESALRDVLGGAAFETAWAEGGSLELDCAVEAALEDPAG